MYSPDDLKLLTLVELKNLVLKELREFSAMLDKETSEQIEKRKQRIHQLDVEIVNRKNPDSKVRHQQF
jgi:hypothetical protein